MVDTRINALTYSFHISTYAKFTSTNRVRFMAIAYDFPFNLSVTEISASAYGDDIKASHKIDHINQQITVIKLIMYTIYSKEMCIWWKLAPTKSKKILKAI